MKNILDLIGEDKYIIYGPFIEDLYTELKYWVPFLRSYYKDKDDKRFVISTRESRKDLYFNCCEPGRIITFNNVKDVQEYRENLNLSTILSNTDYELLKSKTVETYCNVFDCFIEPKDIKHSDFNGVSFDYEFETTKNNDYFINTIMENHINKRIICISAPLKSGSMKLWDKNKWSVLLKQCERNKDMFFIFLGNKDTHYQCPNNCVNAINISNFVNPFYDTTLLGLEIAALKNSDFLITVVPNNTLILAYLLKVPTLFWGNKVENYLEKENIFRTKSVGINDTVYSCDPYVIYKHLIKNFT